MAQNSSPSLNVDLPNINIHLARAPTNSRRRDDTGTNDGRARAGGRGRLGRRGGVFQGRERASESAPYYFSLYPKSRET